MLIKSFKERKALRQILKENKDKIVLTKGPKGHYWFDAVEGVAFDELILPDYFSYPQRLYGDNGGGQFLIMNGDKQLGRIDTYTDKKTK